MRLTLIGPAYPYRGGISHFNTEMAKAFCKEKETEVQLINFKRLYPDFIFPGKTQFDESKSHSDISSLRLIDVCNPMTWFAAVRAIKRFKPDAVFFQWWTPLMAFPYLLIARMLRKEGIRFAAVMHNIEPHESIPLSKGLFSAFVLGMNLQIVMSRGAEERLRNQFDENKRERLNILTLFHPLYDFFLENREASEGKLKEHLEHAGFSPEQRAGKRVLLFFGLVRKYKALKKLIRALPKLNETRGTLLLVAGEFYEPKEEYQKLVSDLGMGENVFFLDRYVANEDVPAIMGLADVLVCPYESGEQSGVIATALACRLPVITMGGKGIGEVVEDGVTGLLLATNEPEEISEKIEKFHQLTENTDFKGNIARKAREYSWGNFTHSIIEKIR